MKRINYSSRGEYTLPRQEEDTDNDDAEWF